MRHFVSLLFAVLLFVACSDDNVIFNASDAETVSVKAYIMRIGDSSYSRFKADTLFPSDSIILLAVIEPSRSIRITQFYWQIDSGETFSEFSHKALFSEPGKHIAKFVLLDRFADTLTDSVIFWIAPSPVLNSENFIPKNHSSEMPFESSVSFSWNVTSENFLAKTTYPFTLKCENKTLADTTLHASQFTYKGKLPPLSLCSWQVYAQDDFGRFSKDTIRSTFYTASSGNSETGSAYFFLNISVEDATNNLSAKLWNSAGASVPIDSISANWNNPVYSLRHLAAGSYRIFFRHPFYRDFSSDTLSFTVLANKITEVESIALRDTVSPIIFSEISLNDSIPWSDTLLFSFIESGIPLSDNAIKIVMDGEILSTWDFENGTLRIFTQNLQPSFLWHPLKISVKDAVGNVTVHTFFISPGRSCIQTLADTVIYKDSSITIPIRNVCSNLTPKRFFWDIDDDKAWDSETSADGRNFVQKTFSGSLFYLQQNTIRVYIQYESGAKFENTFHLYIDGLAG